MIDIKSPNFNFLAKLDLALMQQAALAERNCLEDPNSALMKLRLFGEGSFVEMVFIVVRHKLLIAKTSSRQI